MSEGQTAWPEHSEGIGKRVLLEEAEALRLAASHLGSDFEEAVAAIVACKGRIVVSGVGKSGHVGRKVAATLASTGTPSFFVHAAEAGHGDLGMITDDDVVLAISYSGESEEVINLASFSRRFGARILGMTHSATSSVGRLSHVHLSCAVPREACPIGMAPTSSTTLQMALGDALAMAALAQRRFTARDFARTHPLGQLGRRHYLRIRDVMQSIAQIPHCTPLARLIDVVPAMAVGRMGAILVLEGTALAGIFTDSDLRRLITGSAGRLDEQLLLPVGQFMTPKPLCIDADQLASDALRVFEEKRISRIVCIEDQRVVGLPGWHDLLHHKIA